MATLYKTSSWKVGADGTATTPTVKYHDNRQDAEYQYHLFCANIAKAEEYPVRVALLEDVRGHQMKRECYETSLESDTGEEVAE